MEFIRVFDTQVATDVFVFCLSEYEWAKQPDGLLSMWRGHGANGNGVALVFNTGFLTTVPGSRLLISKVRYGTAEERANWIKEFFVKCLTLFNTHGSTPQHTGLTAWNMFRLTLYHSLSTKHPDHSLSTKHPGFKEENEWRIVYLRDLDQHSLLKDKLSYYIRGNTVEPKLKFPIEPLKLEPRQDWTFNSILDRIVLGPTHASFLALSSAKRMLECLGKPEFAEKLWVSQIPDRPIA